MLKQLPNALTLTRLVLAPLVAIAVWQAYAVSGEAAQAQQMWALGAAGLFIVAALTDLFDGMAARALNADSKFGRLIDPIADKALVGFPLIAITLVAWQIGQDLWWVIAFATAVIVLRDVGMTVWRLLAADGEGARVSKLAKWKTAVELVAVGLPILLIATPALLRVSGVSEGFEGGSLIGQAFLFVWLGLLLIAALLSATTAVQYLSARPAWREDGAIEDDDTLELNQEAQQPSVADEILKQLPE
jgi:CDP-diacylglycerol--glycerol-3-phosphate 3-phosphatidyltransferase